MNTYRTSFFARCPANGVRITYDLTIESTVPVMVERILEVVEDIREAYHEDIADTLTVRLPGKQTLLATHHGVSIQTDRGAK